MRRAQRTRFQVLTRRALPCRKPKHQPDQGGHAHRFAMYNSRPNLPNPRLIGHSGVPVWTKAPWKFWTTRQPQDVQYVGTKGFRSGLESFQLFGFAKLDFQGDKIHVTYIDEHGEKEKQETLQ